MINWIIVAMNKKIFGTGVLLVSILSIFSFLSGCTKDGGNADKGNEDTTVILSEGATLTGLFMTHQSMAMEPYYILRATDDGCFMKITNCEPDGYYMTEDEGGAEFPGNVVKYDDTEKAQTEAEFFGYVNKVKDCEHASLVMADDVIVKELMEVINTSDALGWDGYSKRVSMDDVLDSGDTYRLYLQFSDGKTVTVNSYNSSPEGWGDFYVKIRDIFEAHEDYSRYTLQEFSAEKIDRMIVEFYEEFSKKNNFSVDICVRRDLGTWSWTVRLKDSDGLYLEKGTDIGIYGEDNIDTLSFGRMLDVLEKYKVSEWDQLQGTNQTGSKYMTVLIADTEDKVINASGNNVPDNYDEVREEFIKALIEFYEMKK